MRECNASLHNKETERQTQATKENNNELSSRTHTHQRAACRNTDCTVYCTLNAFSVLVDNH